MTPGYFTTADVRSALSFGTVSMSTHIFSTNAKERFPVWLSVTLFTVCIRLSTFAFRHSEIMKQKNSLVWRIWVEDMTSEVPALHYKVPGLMLMGFIFAYNSHDFSPRGRRLHDCIIFSGILD